MTIYAEKVRELVKAGQVACGRVWEGSAADVCVCGRPLNEEGYCEWCGYQEEGAEVGDKRPAHPDSY